MEHLGTEDKELLIGATISEVEEDEGGDRGIIQRSQVTLANIYFKLQHQDSDQ